MGRAYQTPGSAARSAARERDRELGGAIAVLVVPLRRRQRRVFGLERSGQVDRDLVEVVDAGDVLAVQVHRSPAVRAVAALEFGRHVLAADGAPGVVAQEPGELGFEVALGELIGRGEIKIRLETRAAA